MTQQRRVQRSLSASLLVLALGACSSPTSPPDSIRASVADLSQPPAISIAVRTEDGQVVIQGALQALCAPYRLTPAARVTGTVLVVTLRAATAGNACPQDIVWARGYEATTVGVPATVRPVRVLHASDMPSATPEVVFEGPLKTG